MGFIFLISERPRLGRLFAALALFGIVNSIVGTISLTVATDDDSAFFNFLELVVVCAVKGGLFFFTNLHIANLEAAWDLTVMDTQEDFVGQIVASNQSRTFTVGSSFESRNETRQIATDVLHNPFRPWDDDTRTSQRGNGIIPFTTPSGRRNSPPPLHKQIAGPFVSSPSSKTPLASATPKAGVKPKSMSTEMGSGTIPVESWSAPVGSVLDRRNNSGSVSSEPQPF